MNKAGRFRGTKIPSGWMSKAQLDWLARQGASARLAIEVGSFRGRSATAITLRLHGRLYCVDSWAGNRADEYARFRKNLRAKIAAGVVIPVRTDSPEAAPVLLKEHGPTFDFVFIDGDHSYEGCAADIAAYRPLLRVGGVLAGHDYGAKHPGVVQAVDEALGVVKVGPGSIWSVAV